MKKIAMFAAAFALLLPAVRQAVAAPRSFEGTLTDSMCMNKHMMPGKSDAECIKACVKAGSEYVLVVGGKMYSLTAKPQILAEYAGKHVVVEGTLTGSKIAVTQIEEKK